MQNRSQSTFPWLHCSLATVSLLGASLPLAAQDTTLARGGKGVAAVTAMGTKVDVIAKKYARTGAQLTQQAMRDKGLGVDKGGRLYYACQAPAAAATPTNAGTDALATYATSQTFVLHSKPDATRKLYLDFNGHTTSGTIWNTEFTAGAPIVSPAFDTDGNASAFSTAELNAIQDIWKRIAEDFAPWEIDVTTEEPPSASLVKSGTTDTAYGMRMVIGGNSNWLGGPSGGIAYIGSFSWSTATPAFVFPANLGNGYAKYVAEAASHEAGHTLGLSHDGQNTTVEYYGGHNNWAPIMGDSYSAALSQFSKGEYLDPSNTENDLVVVASHAPLSPDLVGNDIASALSLSGTNIDVTGLITSAADADLYRVVTGAGTINLTATGAAPSPNLDIALSLYDGSGNLLTSSSASGLGGTLSRVVTAGTYYIAVEGVGEGTASTGYTDYGSIGQFKLTGTVPGTSNQAPVAMALGTPVSGTAPLVVNFSSAGSYDPEGGALTYNWDFGDGTSSAAANPSKTYSVVGSYTASLVVFDSTGLSSSTTVGIVVTAPVVAKQIYISAMTISKEVSATKGTRAKVLVTIRDQAGVLKPNTKVTGRWSGLTTSSSVTATTSSSGVATFTSAYSKGTGTFTFTATGAVLSGFTYAPARNVLSTVSIVK